MPDRKPQPDPGGRQQRERLGHAELVDKGPLPADEPVRQRRVVGLVEEVDAEVNAVDRGAER
jgi:hypothetical protein